MLKTAILEFLNVQYQSERKKPKNKNKTDEELLAEHQPEVWIADAAQQVGQIQQVTHAIKFTHPSAQGSNWNVNRNPKVSALEVSSLTIDYLEPDLVFNSQEYSKICKFLRLTVNEKSIQKRAEEGDSALMAVLSNCEENAKGWAAAFASLSSVAKVQDQSHTLAKQIYWKIDNNEYHLLAPLFPTSLVHVIWENISENSFSDATIAAREARQKGLYHPNGYCEYPNIVVQRFGGKKPQNISQFNIERHGEAFLLPSVPPAWRSSPIRPPLRTKSIFGFIMWQRPRMRELVETLRKFLNSVDDVESNRRIRNKRAELAGYIRDELIQFGSEFKELSPGWSSDSECLLNADEQCWLDREGKN